MHQSNEIELTAEKSNFNLFMNFIEQRCNLFVKDNSILNLLLTACEEIVVNIINYAYPKAAGKLKIIFNCNNEMLTIEFVDCGEKFNPLEISEVDISKSLEEREPGGLGILMVKRLMDNVVYNYKEKENHLIIMKNISTTSKKD